MILINQFLCKVKPG